MCASQDIGLVEVTETVCSDFTDRSERVNGYRSDKSHKVSVPAKLAI